MKRSIAIVYVAGLFLLGIVIGALGMHLVHMHAVEGPFDGPPVRGMRGAGGSMNPDMHFEMVAEQLELTGEQRETVRAILDDGRRQAVGLHEEMLPHVRELMDRTRERIDEVLTPEQRERLESMAEHHRGGLERLLLGHGPGGGPPMRGRRRPAEGRGSR